MTRLVRGLADLARGYKVILSDVWGVVHNGRVAFESATEALGRFRVGGGIPISWWRRAPSCFIAPAIAERYAGAGGKVIQTGKPFAPIFVRALELAQGPCTKAIDRARVLVIGDAMRTDIKGAHDQGFDSLFVTSGIHRKELHGGARDTGLDAAAFRQFMDAADFAPAAAIPELVW